MPERSRVWPRLAAALDRGRLTALLASLVERYSPSYAEGPALEVLEGALVAAGVPFSRQRVADRDRHGGPGNLLVEIGPQPPSLLWVGHIDTVPPCDDGQLDPRIDGDLLHGLGAADMKGACAAMAEVVAAIAASGLALQEGLAVAFVVGEEESGDGSLALRERVRAPLTVVGEPTSLVPCLEHFRYREYRLACKGSRAHAALPELGSSAIHAMLSWLTALQEESALLGGVAVNPRQIRGGGDLFVVAEQCEAQVDVHASPAAEDKAVAHLIGRARSRVEAAHPTCFFEHEEVYVAPGYALAESDPRIRPLVRAFERTGLPWRPGSFRSHSDGPLFHEAGSATIMCGPGRLEVAHTDREHVSLDEVFRAARLYAATIVEVCAPVVSGR